MQIEFNRLDRLYQMHAEAYDRAALRVLRSGWYVLGPEVEAFEREFSAFVGAAHCVGLNSGMDALELAIRALEIGEGDEVIVPSNTYIATVLGVSENGATPVYVEPDRFHNIDPDRIEAAITPRTKAILAVHLYGQAAAMDRVVEIARRHRLALLEDCAQSHSACYRGQQTGTFGIAGCFSFFPTKNLGAFGDAGAVVTDDAGYADKLRTIRNYGSREKYRHEVTGVNSRLDELQAALLRERLRHLPQIIAERQRIAAFYLEHIHNPKIELPATRDGSDHVWHLFVVQSDCRNALQEYLARNGIKTQIHYPIPPHRSACYLPNDLSGTLPVAEHLADRVLSLPLYGGMTAGEMQYVADTLNRF